MKNQFRNI